jgi:shikimate kinase
MNKNLILIGARGAGKSKVSRKLSKQTGQPIVSTDMIATYELGGISISSYVNSSTGSWSKFRELEYSILQKLTNAKGIILDCGGGILFDLDSNGNEIYSERKVSILKSIGKIIWLNRDKEYLLNKVKDDFTRPTLSVVENYSSTLDRRLHFYKQTADYSFQIDNMDSEDIAEMIVKSIS